MDKSFMSMVDLHVTLLIEFLKSVPKTLSVLFLVLFGVLAAQPANAAQVSASTDDPVTPSDILGCPTLSWMAPITSDASDLTGMFFGFVVIAIMLVMFGAGVGLLFARRRQDKADNAVASMKNALTGGVIILIGVPIGAAVLWALATLFNPAC